MDPAGGGNPSTPRLDNTNSTLPPAPEAGSQAVSSNVGGSIPAEMPAMPMTAPAVPEGAGIDLNQSPQPVMDPALATASPASAAGGSNKAKVIILVVLGVLVLAGLLVGSYVLGRSAGKTAGRNEAAAEFQNQVAAEQTSDEEVEAPDEDDNSAALELGDLKDPAYKDETVEGETGQQLEAGDGLVLKVTNIERNFKANDPNYKLDASKELVKVNFLLGNVTKDKPKDLTSFNFRLENSGGAQQTPENIASYEGKFDTVKIDPGSQTKGSIVYAVNKDEKPLKFIREQRYRITGQNREVTTRIAVSIAK